MKATMPGSTAGCMRGRTMYVVPFCMGPLGRRAPEVRRRDHRQRLRRRLDADHDPHGRQACCAASRSRRPTSCPACTRSGAPLEPGQADVPWPCNDTKYIVHFPETRRSGASAPATAATPCWARSATRCASPRCMARDEGWLAEHMLILKLTSPAGRRRTTSRPRSRRPAARPTSRCSQPTIPGWRPRRVGDDIAWMRFGDDGRLYAVNPEFGFFGVAPGTNWKTNPNAMRTIEHGNSLFTNVALTDDGDVWWEGLEDDARAPHLVDRARTGRRTSAEPAAHPNSPLLHADRAVPDPRPGVGRPAGRADLGDPLRRPPRDHCPAGHRGSRLAARRLPGRHAVQRDDRRRRPAGRRGAPRPDGHAALHRLQRR